jgi:hypothetical protein
MFNNLEIPGQLNSSQVKLGFWKRTKVFSINENFRFRRQGDQTILWKKSPKMLPNPFFVQINARLLAWEKSRRKI